MMMRSVGIAAAVVVVLAACGSPDHRDAGPVAAGQPDTNRVVAMDTTGLHAACGAATDPHAHHGAAAPTGDDPHGEHTPSPSRTEAGDDAHAQ
ncbi:MAG TPA: hypothetical protein VGW38_01205, partial [Chloroflexota bacterium]|nr:hypothetical protein [Chloroflexota bacterium]